VNKRELNREFGAAFEQNDAAKIERLVALGADINAVRNGGQLFVPLWLAVHAAGDEISETSRNLSQMGAEYFGFPRRDHVAKREEALKSIEILLNAKADVNRKSFGSTPLRIAVKGRDTEVVQILLSNGADPNAETYSIFSRLAKKTVPGYYNTVLHEAVEKCSLEIVEQLLNAGADPFRTDHEGKTPLDIAQDEKFTDIAAVLRKATASRSK
jgi:ankyrin repeat protein